MSESGAGHERGSVLSAHNINYIVKQRKGCCRQRKKIILNNVNGIFKPGMNGIMGPTGSGKTSLLDVLAGRKDPTGLSGHVLVDSQPQPENFKCMTGYVVQDDVVMGTLTVRENFMFSANLRLPASVGRKEKEARVEATMNELGLTQCGDTKVGTEFIRGVSGGERKRTNIGMELIIKPNVLFLDEPTTGLDASTSHAVMLLLHNLARKGTTIIFSIHQPRYSIYKLFDQLMLLSHGYTMYHGPAGDALEYFSTIGYNCEEHDNPADFFLDVVNGDSTAVQHFKQLQVPASNGSDAVNSEGQVFSKGAVTVVDVSNFNGRNKAVTPSTDSVMVEVVDEEDDDSERQHLSLAHNLHQRFTGSVWHSQMSAELEPIFDDFTMRKENSSEPAIIGEYATSFVTQFRYLAHRTVLNNLRNPMVSVGQLMVTLVLALVVGGLFFDIEDTVIPGVQNRAGVFFFTIMNQVFINISAVELFIRQRHIFIHENASGFYRVSSFFFSRVFCDFLPMRIAPVLLYSVITYFMTDLVHTPGKFLIFVLVLLLTTLLAASIGFFYGSFIEEFALANLAMSMTFVVMMIFGGLFVNIESVWVGLRWIEYFSLFRYSLAALSINEFKGLEFFEVVNGTRVSAGFGEDLYLDPQGIEYATDWDMWKNMMALAIMIIGFLTLAYIQLRRIKKYK